MTAGGCAAVYQGFVLRDHQFRRSPGLVADSFVVTAIVQNGLPEVLGEEDGDPNVEPLLGGALDQSAPPQPTRIGKVGDLEFFEVLGEKRWYTPVRRIWLSHLDKPDPDKKVGRVTMTLTDSRLWWELGFLDRWRFNVEAVDGGLVADTVNPETGGAWSLAEIAEYIVSRLGRGHTLRRAPERWKAFKVPFTFARFSRAKAALEDVLEIYPARVVLNLDDTVSIWEPGETDAPLPSNPLEPQGFAYSDPIGEGPVAKGAEGKSNTIAIPLEHLRPGADNSTGKEFGIPPKRVLVAGGERWATVAVDWWEPVLEIKGDIYPLSRGLALLNRGQGILRAVEELEELKRLAVSQGRDPTQDTRIQALEKSVARLQRKFFDGPEGEATPAELRHLQRWVLRPESFQTIGGPLRDRRDAALAFEVLARDAYRLWRCPFAETHLFHASPLDRRAETSAGVRAPVQVETYRYRSEVWPVAGVPGALTVGADLAPDGQAQEYFRARARVKAIAGEIDRRIRFEKAQQAGNPLFGPLRDLEDELRARANDMGNLPEVEVREQQKFPGLRPRKIDQSIYRIVQDDQGAYGAGVRAVVAEIGRNPQLLKELSEFAEDRKRFVQTFAARGMSLLLNGLIAEKAKLTDLANSYYAAVAAQAKAAQPLRAKLLNTTDLEIDLARKLIEIGRAVKEARVKNTKAPEVLEATTILDKIVDRFLKWRRAHREGWEGGALSAAVEFRAQATYPTAKFWINLERVPDPDAVVEDAERMLVRTREPAGHLERTDVDDLLETRLVPRPIRVAWGVRLQAPRNDGRPVFDSVVWREALGVRGAIDLEASPPVKTQDWDPEYARPYATSVGLAERDAEAHGNLGPVEWNDLQTDEAKKRADYTAGYYFSVWLRTGAGNVRGPIGRNDADANGPEQRILPPPEEALVVDDPSLVELIGVDGASNRDQLDLRARAAARAQTRKREVLDTGQRVYRHPWHVDCDGIVTGVEIFSGPGLRGIRTRVVIGDDLVPFVDDIKSLQRKRRKPQQQPRKRPGDA